MRLGSCCSRAPLVRTVCGCVLLVLAGAFVVSTSRGVAADPGSQQPVSGPWPPVMVCMQVPAAAWPRDSKRPTTLAAEEERPLGSRIVRADFLDSQPNIQNLTPGFAAACEPDVSF